MLEDCEEEMMPTSVSPALRAFWAWLAAAGLPELCGIDESTIVQPFLPAGHSVSVFDGGGGGGCAGAVGVGMDSVGSGAVSVSVGVVAVTPVPVLSGTDA